MPGTRRLYRTLRNIVSAPSYRYEVLPQNDEAASDAFRLLTLLPGVKGSRISCSIRAASLKSQPVYEALSYTWGDAKSQFNNIPSNRSAHGVHAIDIDGARATVKHNLHAALQQLRDRRLPRVLWVDALCINQSDNAERSGQVKLMARIYGQASRVVCWLGENDAESDLAFDTAEELCWAVKFLVYRYAARKLDVPVHEVTESSIELFLDRELRDEHLRQESPFRSNGNPRDRDRLREALSIIPPGFTKQSDLVQLALSRFGGSRSLARYVVADHGALSGYATMEQRITALKDTFLYRAYWDRLWIVQECFFADGGIVMCGERQLDLRMMYLWEAAFSNKSSITGKSLLWENGDFDTTDALTSAMGGLLMVHYSRTLRMRSSLASAIYSNRHKTCGEPRDAVYAILNMVPPVHIEPDYDRSMADLFTDTTITIIRQEKNLNILCMAQDLAEIRRLRRKPCELPSWVPHFEGPVNSFDLITFNYSFDDQMYRGNGPMNGSILDDESTPLSAAKTLAIQGVLWGTVEHVAQRIDAFEMTNQALWQTLIDILNSATSKHLDLDIGQFWRTLFIDQYLDNTALHRRISTTAEAMSNFADDMEVMNDMQGISKRLFEALRPSSNGKTFCLVSQSQRDASSSHPPKRYVPAMACGEVQVGDLVFAARGATVPFIVRKAPEGEANGTDDGQSHYAFVGGSYVHGIMDGEAIDMIGDSVREETVYLV